MRRIRLNLSALRARRLPRLLRPGLSAADLLDSQEALTLTRRKWLGLAGAAAVTLPSGCGPRRATLPICGRAKTRGLPSARARQVGY
jgi:hypothetical protein